MTPKDELTRQATELVRTAIAQNTMKCEAEIGPVVEAGTGRRHGRWRVTVERVAPD